MTKSLEHSIKSRYEPKPTAVDTSLVEARINDVINKTMFSLIEDLSQPAPPVEDIKKSLATQIAMMLNRVADKTNPVNVQYLVAALLLLQLSTGDDPLMAIARRLSVKGMGQTQKKIKEEIEPIEELSVQKLNQYVNDNHTARRKNLGKLIRTKKDKAEYIKRWDGAGIGIGFKNRCVSSEQNCRKHHWP
jgi:ribosomal protein L23